MSMEEDRWFSAWSKIQQRCAASTTEFDYTLLYPTRVVEWEESGINPSGLVGVVFTSEPAATKLRSKKGVPVLPPVVGQRYVPVVGSQILVGWQGGDERYPYATGWLRLGGADEVAHAFETSYSFEGPLVDVVGDLKSEHELGRSAGTLSATPGTNVATATVSGDDTSFDLTLVIDPTNPATGNLAVVTFGRAFAAAPRAVLQYKSGTAVLKLKYSSTTTTLTVAAGESFPNGTNHVVTAFVRG